MQRAGHALAFLLSLVLHVAALLILACVVYRVGQPSRGVVLTAVQGSSQSTSLEMLDSFELAAPLADQLSEPSVPKPSVTLDIPLDALLEQPGDTQVAASLASVSVSDVVDSLKEGGRRQGASFFGTYAEGSRFVYVLDSSRSMRGDRWTYACNQLISSLQELKPGQEFFVICFDMQTSFLFNLPPARASYFEADDETIVRVKRWLRARTLGRATMPAEALKAGLEFNPDAIFLLSDGELQDNSIGMLRMLNGLSAEPRQIPIHTIHLFSPEGRMSLELIALENGGSFTHVDGR